MNVSEIERSIITVHSIDNGRSTRCVINIAEMRDPAGMLGPIIPGIMLSDLLDHIVNAYPQMGCDRDQRDIRRDILKAMKDEDRFKEKDPSRGGMEGGLVRQ
jgi:hypothetical protein